MSAWDSELVQKLVKVSDWRVEAIHHDMTDNDDFDTRMTLTDGEHQVIVDLKNRLAEYGDWITRVQHRSPRDSRFFTKDAMNADFNNHLLGLLARWLLS